MGSHASSHVLVNKPKTGQSGAQSALPEQGGASNSRDTGESSNPDGQAEGTSHRVSEFRKSAFELNLEVKEGLLESEEVDAIVNTTRSDLRLDCGGVSGAILKAAGLAVQEECSAGHPDPLEPGQSLSSTGFALTGIMSLKLLLSNALKEAETRRYKSIAFPAIGTGKLQYPRDQVLLVMLYEIQMFISTHPFRTLNDIRVVVHPEDGKTNETFRQIISETNKEDPEEDSSDMDHTKEGLPKSWIPMDPEKVCELVKLEYGSEEYRKVASRFRGGDIKSIERVQNPLLYKMYTFLEKQVKERNPDIEYEMVLYHGTAPDAICNINNSGFNRSYCGKNATSFGDGVYFAGDPMVSAAEKYSPPDSDGNRFIYQARVLVGKSVEGQRGLLEPPLIGDPSGRRYDSVYGYDRRIFVIFRDYAAYPEYLITFKSYDSITE